MNIPAPPTLALPPIEKPKPQLAPPAAAPPPSHPSVIGKPDWSQRPNAEDVARYYPQRAERMSIAGRAEISCTVQANGKLSACSVTSEDPADQGFGDAALKLSKLFKMRPKTLDGAPSDGGVVKIPLRFVLPKE